MRAIQGMLLMLLAAAGSFAFTALIFSRAHSAVAQSISISDDTTRVPQSNAVRLVPLPSSHFVFDGLSAIREAERAYGLNDAEIDANSGAVRANISLLHDVSRQDIEGWIITANHDTYAPWGGGVYHKLEIVIDGASGQYRFAYTADFTTK